jgi:hypothetical protein
MDIIVEIIIVVMVILIVMVTMITVSIIIMVRENLTVNVTTVKLLVIGKPTAIKRKEIMETTMIKQQQQRKFKIMIIVMVIMVIIIISHQHRKIIFIMKSLWIMFIWLKRTIIYFSMMMIIIKH